MDRIGRYKVVRELGRGAMGVVYHAIDPNIGRPLAIKTIRLGGSPEEQERLRERLFREARSAGILSHPGIVTIYDVEQQGDTAYIAMEYVNGPTLDRLMSAEDALPPELIFNVLAQTAVALDYAHQKGIVHRDIKPANIMIAGGGAAKITDFGIAKVAASEQFTMTGTIVGTPHYMSPEQVQGKPVNGRADQFSLAVIAFEILTGDKPFTGEQLTTVVYKIVNQDTPPPNRLNTTLSAPIAAALRKGLAKNPEERFPSCQAFVESLEKACNASRGWKPLPRGGGLNEPTAALPVAVAPGAGPGPAARRQAGDDTETGERRRNRRSGFFAFLLSFLVVAGVLALIGWQADPTLPRKAQGLAQRIEAALGLGAAPPEQPAPAGQSAAQPPAPTAGAALAEAAKPSPMPAASPSEPPPEPPKSGTAEAAPAGPPLPAPPAQTPARTAVRKTVPRLTMQPASIASAPEGATVSADGMSGPSCVTPCELDLPPGRHTLAISLPGYVTAFREVPFQ